MQLRPARHPIAGAERRGCRPAGSTASSRITADKRLRLSDSYWVIIRDNDPYSRILKKLSSPFSPHSKAIFAI